MRECILGVLEWGGRVGVVVVAANVAGSLWKWISESLGVVGTPCDGYVGDSVVVGISDLV